ncbi:MAG: hypothetical protein U1E25_14620 [Methylocystis sp.]
MQEVAGLGKDVFGGIISGLREGKSVGETFLQTLNKIADKLTSLALDAAFDSFGKKGAGTSATSGLLNSIASFFKFDEEAVLLAHQAAEPCARRSGHSQALRISRFRGAVR